MRDMTPSAGPDGGFDAVLAAARSWARPPAARTVGRGFEAAGYDPAQRAYVWRRTDASATALKARIDASRLSPIENLSLVVEGWDDPAAQVLIDGRPAADVRFGHVRGLPGDRMIVWIGLRIDGAGRPWRSGAVGERDPSQAGGKRGAHAYQ
ncbi:MAG: hypothetical protein M0C28_40140 [Candidatus Moduliflexus flocculans]|nr:hypothetical protein [Candidatus Moduliflexus flocculans]